MGLFRDIASINYPGGSSALPGCQEVSLECTGDEIEHSACDDLAIAYRGLTALTCTADVTLRAGATLVRDVSGVSLGGVAILNTTSVAVTLTANELSDSSDNDSWLTYVGVTGRSVEVVITSRCVDLAGNSKLKLGCIGAFTAQGSTGAVAGCPSGGTNDGAGSITFSLSSMMVTSVQVNATHGDFAEMVVTAKGTAGSDGFTGGTTGIPMASKPGKTDTFSFKVLDATSIAEATTTTGKTFTLSNAVLMENSVTLTHGEMLENSFSVKAFSGNGQTSPLSVS